MSRCLLDSPCRSCDALTIIRFRRSAPDFSSHVPLSPWHRWHAHSQWGIVYSSDCEHTPHITGVLWSSSSCVARTRVACSRRKMSAQLPPHLFTRLSQQHAPWHQPRLLGTRDWLQSRVPPHSSNSDSMWPIARCLQHCDLAEKSSFHCSVWSACAARSALQLALCSIQVWHMHEWC